MVKVLLYGYCVGVASSRRIAQRLHEGIAFRVLAANNTPDFRTISDFRKDNVNALSGLLTLCKVYNYPPTHTVDTTVFEMWLGSLSTHRGLSIPVL